ncbi:hypothetical protein UA08_02026 [Talaromyces atroroseus]|uniref:Uncharacterized protein n=1 Tax=Talaromyces atroroseus TaxID=1441469 RepID=A0A1Q5QAT4_TALAT|nr:hypothetical protein UA08_02026 [Talaromyces atroroseus]OKL63052.1 hypothetical protein UA08_02026 [Talaromyces atroroseus]
MTENRMSTPTLINLPPPPSDPVTPSEMGPGTPNSGTTSLSALSTTAIKDGHQGHPHPYARHTHHSSSASATSTSTLDAERADRISRLAGLERIATARAGGMQHGMSGSAAAAAAAGGGFPSHNYTSPNNNSNNNNQLYNQGYFDSYPQMLKERSTVGSASATGSIGGRTTWASGSDAFFDPDKMSEDHDNDGASSVGGMSDEGNASLVGFGEGANSTISGPISSARYHQTSNSSSSSNNNNVSGRTPSFGSPPGGGGGGGGATNRNNSGMQPLSFSSQQQQQHLSPSPAGSNTPEPLDDARMVDGMTYDADVVDTTVRTPRLVESNHGSEVREQNSSHSAGEK